MHPVHHPGLPCPVTGNIPSPGLLRPYSPGTVGSSVQGAWAGLGAASWLTPSFLPEPQSLGSSWQPCSDVLATEQVGIQRARSLEGAGEEGGRASGEFQGCWSPVWRRQGTAEMRNPLCVCLNGVTRASFEGRTETLT